MDPKQQFSTLKEIALPLNAKCSFEDDYIYMSVDDVHVAQQLFSSFANVPALLIGIVNNGKFSGTIGTELYHVNKNSLIVLSGNQALSIKDHGEDPVKLELVIFSSSLLHDINIAPNSINLESILSYKPSPVYEKLPDDVVESVHAYMTLLRNNTDPEIEPSFAKNISRSLVQAIFYQLFQLNSTKSKTKKDIAKTVSINYVHDFMILLQLHHSHHRDISFYADKLFISAKYLSAIIKKATGRSAAQWIDHFVINEAKNMLRFSNKNIQQVSIALNFPTQSAFGKYFKHLTGLSPSEYQKT